MKMHDWVRSEIQSLSAYHVADATGMVKLDAMENPYQWDDDLKQQWLAKLASAEINRYPDPAAQGIKERLYAIDEIDSRYPILLGNGSDEIIQILAMTIGKPGSVILSPLPSFVMYSMIATFTERRFVGVELNHDFSLNEAAMLEAIETHQPGIVFLAHPNNPTGNVYNPTTLEKIIEAAPGLVVLDEAYRAFTDANGVEWLAKYENLVVMRTLSKVGLAGLRLGYLVGHSSWLNEFEKVRLPYNINQLTQLSVEFALDHVAVLRQQAEAIKQQRSVLINALETMDDIEPFPSEANFVLCRLSAAKPAAHLFDYLKAHGVLIKKLDGSHPLLQNCLRLTVGTAAENEILINTLADGLSNV